MNKSRIIEIVALIRNSLFSTISMLLKEAIIKAFSTILKGLVLDYFYNNYISKELFNYVSIYLYSFFKELRY